MFLVDLATIRRASDVLDESATRLEPKAALGDLHVLTVGDDAFMMNSLKSNIGKFGFESALEALLTGAGVNRVQRPRRMTERLT